MYSPYHFAPSPALSAGSDLLSRSIMQLAETQSHSLEIFAAQQKSQIDVYQELTRSNKEKEHDALFTLIPVFDGDHTQCEQWLVIGTVYPNIPLSSAIIHGHPPKFLRSHSRSAHVHDSLWEPLTVSSVWPISASRLNLRPHPPIYIK